VLWLVVIVSIIYVHRRPALRKAIAYQTKVYMKLVKSMVKT